MPAIRRTIPLLSTILVAATMGVTPAAAQPRADRSCDPGEFCAWSAENYGGQVKRLDVESANPGECVALQDNLAAKSFANRLSREVTVYQGATCSTEADFTTYPGGGTFVPAAPFVVRAIQIWEP